MKDLLLISATKRVVDFGDRITQTATHFIRTDKGATANLWKGGFDAALEIAAGAADPPGDLVRGVNYNYVQGAYADSGSAPAPASARRGKNLTWDEFLAVGMATDSVRINTLLVKLPVAAEWGRKYQNIAGIEFADAGTPGTRLTMLLEAAVAAGIITSGTITDFLKKWVELYPAEGVS